MPDHNNIVVAAAALYIDGVHAGYTQGGVAFRKSHEWVDVDADQLGGVARKVKTYERAMLTTTLLEATLANLRQVMNEASSQLVGSALQIGSGTLVTNEYVLTVIGKGVSGKTRTYTFYRAVFVDDLDHTIGARDAASSMNVGFELLKDPAHGNNFGVAVDTPAS